MTSPDSDVTDVDPFIEALRCDLPSDEQERRIRARLVGAGVVAGAGLIMPGVAGAASATANAGLVPKLALWSWGAKVGLAGLIVAVGVPIASELAKTETSAAPPTVVTATRVAQAQNNGDSRPHRAEQASSAAPPITFRSTTPAAIPQAASPLELARRTRPQPEVSRRDAARPGTAPTADAPSVGGFPEIETSSAARGPQESSLREEAELIERALSALRSGERTAALRWLAEHSRRFPDGQLRRERDRARERASSMIDGSGSSAPSR